MNFFERLWSLLTSWSRPGRALSPVVPASPPSPVPIPPVPSVPAVPVLPSNPHSAPIVTAWVGGMLDPDRPQVNGVDNFAGPDGLTYSSGGVSTLADGYTPTNQGVARGRVQAWFSTRPLQEWNGSNTLTYNQYDYRLHLRAAPVYGLTEQDFAFARVVLGPASSVAEVHGNVAAVRQGENWIFTLTDTYDVTPGNYAVLMRGRPEFARIEYRLSSGGPLRTLELRP